MNTEYRYKINKAIISYSIVLLILFLIHWYIFVQSGINIPEDIPGTPFNINGLGVMIIVITCLILFNKKIHSINSEYTVFNRVVLSLLCCLLSEIVFQAIRVPLLEDISISEGIIAYPRAIIVDTLLCTIPSFFIAFQIKTRKTGLMLIILFTFLVVSGLLLQAFRLML